MDNEDNVKIFTRFIEYEKVTELIFYVESEIGMEAEKVHVSVK